MFVFGVILAMPGALFGIAEFRSRLGVDLAQQGDVFLALYAGVLLSTLIAGPAIDSFGNKPVLSICAVISAISLGALAFARGFPAGMAVAFFLGCGGGPLNTSANALVAELYDRERAAMLNIVGMFFGAGALTAALLATRVAPSTSLLAAGAVVAICAIGTMTLSFPPPRVITGFSLTSSLRAARLPGAIIFSLICFCESGEEAAIGGFISTYAGPWALVGYLLPFTISRFIASRVANVVRPVTLVIGCALMSAAGCALIVVGRPTAFAGAMLAGVAVAPVYPAVLALAADRHQAVAGTLFGLMFAVGLSGAVVFPFAVGHIAQHAGVAKGMLLPLAGALTIAALIYSGNRTSKTAPPPS